MDKIHYKHATLLVQSDTKQYINTKIIIEEQSYIGMSM